MTYTELARALASAHALTQKDARLLLDNLFALVGGTVARGKRLSIPGFGVFTRRSRKSRRVRNPETKALMRLPKSFTVGFRACGELKRRCCRG